MRSQNCRLHCKSTLVSHVRERCGLMFIVAFRGAPSGLPSALKSLYTQMSRTTESVVPGGFLASLRQAFPQFAERAQNSKAIGTMLAAYSQQGLCDEGCCGRIAHSPIHRCRRVLDTADKFAQGSTGTPCIFFGSVSLQEVHRSILDWRDAARVSVITRASLPNQLNILFTQAQV